MKRFWRPQAWLGGFLALASVLGGCGDPADPAVDQVSERLVGGSSEVAFTGCTEFAGIGLVPTANARPLVPAEYELAGDAENAVIVVRVADCDGISVAGKKPKPGTVAQVGITVAPIDETASINNYTLWFATNLGPLHAKLRSKGVASELDSNLAYSFVPVPPGQRSLTIAATPPKGPAYSVAGTALVPTAAPVPFIATWWAETAQGSVRMRTEFPEIRFADATMTLSTPASSALAALVGDSTLTFAILDSHNAFEAAALSIDVVN